MDQSPPSRPARFSRVALGGLVAGLSSLLILAATEPHLAIVWDEGYTLLRLERVRTWFAFVNDPVKASRHWDARSVERSRRLQDQMPAPRAEELMSRDGLFRPRVLAWFWPFAREEPHGHPPFYAWAALVGDVVGPRVGLLTRARVGSMLLFSVACGWLFTFAARRWGLWSGLAAASAWLLHPHLFALAHYATYDALLASLWLMALLAFCGAAGEAEKWPRWGATIGFGLLLGCALGTKFTAWLLPLPILAWVLLYRSRAGLLAWLVGGVIGVLTFVALCPPLWGDPWGGLVRFFESNLSRGATIPIKTRFLGRVYETPIESLPWYNTMVWLVMASPIMFLCFAGLGGAAAVRHWRAQREASLFLICAVFVLFLRALPHTPGHDGTRQLAAGFGSLAPVCGLGAAVLLSRAARAGRLLVSLWVMEMAASVALLMPVPLSYFSPLVGGLPGATALGMEPTYYWDGLTGGALRRIDARVPRGTTVLFVAHPTAWYLKEAGLLRSGLYPDDGRRYSWLVMQNRPGSMSAAGRRLVTAMGDRPDYVISEKFGVPLVWAFPAEATRP